MLAPWAPHTHDVRTIVGAGVELALARQLRAAVDRLRARARPTRRTGGRFVPSKT